MREARRENGIRDAREGTDTHTIRDSRWQGHTQIMRWGKVPVNVQTSAYYNVAHPDLGADWQIRFLVAVLLPTSLFEKKN